MYQATRTLAHIMKQGKICLYSAPEGLLGSLADLVVARLAGIEERKPRSARGLIRAFVLRIYGTAFFMRPVKQKHFYP